MRTVALILITSSLLAQGEPPGLEGNWLGSLEIGPDLKLRLAFHITRSTSGAFTGTLDSLDQGSMGMQLTSVSINGAAVSIELQAPPATYTGTLNNDGTEIAGEWNMSRSLPLTLARVAATAVTEHPQEPKPPFSYRAQDVTYPSKSLDVQLAGTLTLPKSGGPFPAVLLITDSGAQDRDETLFGHKPFLVIADYLTRQGIAVLRVDDREKAKSTGTFAGWTTADLAEDAAGSLAYLKSRKEIDPKRIGLIGHGEGAVIAPIMATQNGDVAFIVMMAGTGVSGSAVLREVLKVQAAGIMRAGGASQAEIDQNAADQEQVVLTPTSPWMRYFVELDPATILRKLKTPVLVLNGALDLQVLPSQNLPAIVQALEQAHNPDYEVIKFPGLNHLFQTAKTGSPGEYAQITETISPAVLSAMAQWIQAHTGGPRQP